MSDATNKGAAKFGVYSEVGQLRKVMVCAPGRAHQRLTPSNCDQLLFDDVLWVENAKRDHFDFVQKMRDRGVDVVEMHNLLAETVAVPEGKKWILDNQIVPNQVGLGFIVGAAQLPRGTRQPRAGRDADRRPVHARVPGIGRRHGAARSSRKRPASPSTCCRRCRTRCTRATPRAGSTAASRSIRCTGRRGTRRRSSPRPSTSSIPDFAGKVNVWWGDPDRGPRARHAGRRRRDAHRQGQRADRHERAHVAAGHQPARGHAVQEGRGRARDRGGHAEDPRGDAPRHRVHVRRPRLRAAGAGFPGQDHHVLVPSERSSERRRVPRREQAVRQGGARKRSA